MSPRHRLLTLSNVTSPVVETEPVGVVLTEGWLRGGDVGWHSGVAEAVCRSGAWRAAVAQLVCALTPPATRWRPCSMADSTTCPPCHRRSSRSTSARPSQVRWFVFVLLCLLVFMFIIVLVVVLVIFVLVLVVVFC